MARPTSLLTPAEVRQAVEKGEYVTGVVTLDLGDIIDNGLEWLCDELSRQLVGNELVTDITWQVVGFIVPSTIMLKVEGDASLAAQFIHEPDSLPPAGGIL
jgi:hypothetical protein